MRTKPDQDRKTQIDIGTIKLRSPGGHSNSITVSVHESGSVDIHFARTSEGEALMRLPIFAASQLSELLRKATEPKGEPT